MTVGGATPALTDAEARGTGGAPAAATPATLALAAPATTARGGVTLAAPATAGGCLEETAGPAEALGAVRADAGGCCACACTVKDPARAMNPARPRKLPS